MPNNLYYIVHVYIYDYATLFKLGNRDIDIYMTIAHDTQSMSESYTFKFIFASTPCPVLQISYRTLRVYARQRKGKIEADLISIEQKNHVTIARTLTHCELKQRWNKHYELQPIETEYLKF